MKSSARVRLSVIFAFHLSSKEFREGYVVQGMCVVFAWAVRSSSSGGYIRFDLAERENGNLMGLFVLFALFTNQWVDHKWKLRGTPERQTDFQNADCTVGCDSAGILLLCWYYFSLYLVWMAVYFHIYTLNRQASVRADYCKSTSSLRSPQNRHHALEGCLVAYCKISDFFNGYIVNCQGIIFHPPSKLVGDSC